MSSIIFSSAGANWRQLTETDKIPYDKLAEIERQKYEAAMREYSQVNYAISGFVNICCSRDSIKCGQVYQQL
jgi:hypothetical protein